MAEVVRLFPEPSRLKRPAPPVAMQNPENLDGPTFVPAPELEKWLRSTFIEEAAPLQNDDHFHLRFAQVGVLWTSIENGPCHICGFDVRPGMLGRRLTKYWETDKVAMTYRYCTLCTEAMAARWTDEGEALDERYSQRERA
jgi:hypothetical protein